MAQVKRRLPVIEAEMAKLKASDLYHLKATVEEAESLGRDPLGEMASQVAQQIAAARNRLAATG